MERILLLFLVLTLGGVFLTVSQTSGQNDNQSLPFIHVEGNHFVDESGKVFVFRWVSFSDPDRLEKAGHWNKAYFEAAKNWHANIVRFPVHPQAWRERGENAYLQLLDQGIEWAAELGLYVIIDWHSIGNLRTELFQHPMYNTTKTETFRFWKTIAARYVNNPVVVCYELFNEPTQYNGTLGRLTWEQHKELMEDLFSIIYAHDQSVIPLVGGLDWAYDLTFVRYDPIAFPGVAYVTHPYPQKRQPPWQDKWEENWGFVADKYPVIATEFGFMSADGRGAHIPVISDESYGEAIIDYFTKKGISWTTWVFDPLWSPQLIENWQFEPTRQGRFLKDKLAQLNQNVVTSPKSETAIKK